MRATWKAAVAADWLAMGGTGALRDGTGVPNCIAGVDIELEGMVGAGRDGGVDGVACARRLRTVGAGEALMNGATQGSST